MPPDMLTDFLEAREVFPDSPRASAALLRLAVQKLCIHLGEEGKNLNNDVAALVRKGLPVTYQQALDTARVTGNNAVHPGELSGGDTAAIARSLFDIVNWTVEATVTRPDAIAREYAKLPAGAKRAVQERDGRS